MSIINKSKNLMMNRSDNTRQALYRFSMNDLHALMRREKQEKEQAAQLRAEQERQEEVKEQQAQHKLQKVDWSRRVLLADISASMGSSAHNGKSRYQNLYEATKNILAHWPMRLVVFSINAKPCRNIEEMDYLWRTREGMGAANNEINALQCAQRFNPEYTLLISDGGTYDAHGVISYVTKSYPGAIDALYIGPYDNYAGIAFLQKLVQIKGGRCDVNDLNFSGQPTLEESIKSLILRQL